MRVAVLPREVAARVITGALARGAWAVNATSVALAIPILLEFAAHRGISDGIALPLSILVALVGLAILASFVPRPWVVAGYMVIAGTGAVGYELWLIAVHPAIASDGLFLLNRPAASLVLIGVGAATTAAGILWATLGLAASALVTVIVSILAQVPLAFGFGPLLFYGVYVVVFLILLGIQVSQRKRLPNLDELEAETRRLAVEENLRARVAAAVHDTLLNDLSIVMNAPDELDDRARERLRADVATLTSVEWLRESAEVTATDDQDSMVRNQLMVMVSELQWRGLTVHVTGSGSGIYRLTPDAATALIDAVRACLENVLRHAGTPLAEVDLAYSSDELTVMVSDQGIGFDPEAISADRLGLRHSVVERIRSVGGSVRIWSRPGAGASIVMRVPVVEVVLEHEPSRHEKPERVRATDAEE